jgi:hypothetical protein
MRVSGSEQATSTLFSRRSNGWNVNDYPRFGFVPASRYGIKSKTENVTDEAFTIPVLDQAALESVSGVAKYRPEFNSAI